MKKIVVLWAILLGSLVAKADDVAYPYLTFEATDGAKVSVSVASLTLTVSGTTLTAGSETFTLTNLSKMYFTADDESTDIRSLSVADTDEVVGIYDLKGRLVATDRAAFGQLPKGVYVVRTASGTYKLSAK